MAKSAIYYPNKRFYVIVTSLDGGRQGIRNLIFDEHLGLVVAERPKIKVPEVKTEYVEILGRTGDLDLTGAVDGFVHFGPTEVEIKFVCMPDADFQVAQDTLVTFVLGREVFLTLCEAGGEIDKNYPDLSSFHDPFGLAQIGEEYDTARCIKIEPETDGKLSYITLTFKMDHNDGYVPGDWAKNSGDHAVMIPGEYNEGPVFDSVVGTHYDYIRRTKRNIYNEYTHDNYWEEENN